MKTITAFAFCSLGLFCISAAQADTFGSGTNQFNIAFVPIGNPGNPADTTGDPNPAGSVPYAYRMGKFEISRDMITKANAEGGLGITLDSMGYITGGPRDAMPATGITWFEAAQFVNWLNTSQGHQAAYNFDGIGAFKLWSSAEAWQAGGENLFRHKDAFYFLPNVDEWYKAAYYNPNAGVYYNYPTGSDIAPTRVASGTAAGTAVYLQPIAQGPADITLAGGLSPYGTMGQGGNMWEWEETAFDLKNSFSSSARGIRGGIWVSVSSLMRASERFGINPTFEDGSFGFRVASIPEPSTLLMGALVAGGLLIRRRR